MGNYDNLDDYDLFEFIMNCEFSEEYNIDELKFLIKKLKNFYRILHSKNQHIKDDFELSKIEFNRKENVILSRIKDLENIKNTVENELLNVNKVYKDYKLSFIERLTGKLKKR